MWLWATTPSLNTKVKCFLSSTKNGIQGLLQARQALYHWAPNHLQTQGNKTSPEASYYIVYSLLFVLFCSVLFHLGPPPPPTHTHTLASFHSTVLSSGPGDQRPAQNPMLHWVLVPSTLLPCVMVQFSFFPNFDILKTTIQAFCRLPVSLGWSDVLLLRIKGQTSLARTPRKWCCVHYGVSFCLVTGDEVELIRLLVYFPL